MSNINEFFCGAIGGLTGQILCHPFDTIKTRKQVGDVRLTNLYRGLPSPLASVVIEKSLLFSSYGFIKRYNDSAFMSGILAGIVTTFTVTPFERIKVRSQLTNIDTVKTLKNVMRNDGVLSLYRGWSAVFLREVPGYGLYFACYDYIKRKNMQQNLLTSFLTGSSCGVSAWIFIYPSDPVKTVMQNDNIGVRDSIKKIYNKYGIAGFYKGYLWGLARASILHGGVFVGYEMSKRYC